MPQGTTPMPPTPPARPSRREFPTTTPPKKRKVLKAEMQQQPKKIRPNADMKRYISCKRWREEEEKEKDEGSQSRKKTSEESTPGPIKDPVNVDTPGWKSSQGDQGSGVFGTGGEKSLDDGQKAEEEAPTEEYVSGTRTGVGGEVAPVGGQIPGPDEDPKTEAEEGEKDPRDGQVRVRGASKEDQERYDKLMDYIENKREE